MDELACFAPGMLALGSFGYGPGDSEKFMSLAQEVLDKMCNSMHGSSRSTFPKYFFGVMYFVFYGSMLLADKLHNVISKATSRSSVMLTVDKYETSLLFNIEK